MNITVADVIQILEENRIEFDLRTSPMCPLEFPVNINDFSKNGMTFYVGNDPDKIVPWKRTSHGLIICNKDLSDFVEEGPFLFVEKARRAFALCSYLFIKPTTYNIHSTAIIDPRAKIAKNVSIGPYCVIGDSVIGNNTVIGSHCVLKDNVIVGENVNIFSNVSLGEPGLGSVLNGEGNNILFPHFDKLIIEDNVVVGSGTFIDKGSLMPTTIKRGVHISKCCSIGHNCIIGENTYLSHSVHIGGSAIIGERCWLAIGVCIKDSITITNEVSIGMNATVTRSCNTPSTTIMGTASQEFGSLFGMARILNNQS